MNATIIPLDIVQVFQDRWPELTFYAVLIIVIVLVVWGIAKFYYKSYLTRMLAVEEKVKNSDCIRHSTVINSFDTTANTILRKIDFIEKALVAQDPGMLVVFSQTHSPRQLNPLGNELMIDSGADKVLDEYKDYLISQIEEMHPNTAYDVEQYAYAALIINTSQLWFNPLKEFVFNSPVYKEKSINLGAICFVMSLQLRDYYFEKHPEIDQESDPATK